MDSARWGLQDSGPLTRCPLWQVDLKLTHLNWSPEATLIHFQGLYLTLCELDYHILHGEIQRVQKLRAAVDIGELCLVEDVTSARWYRGRVQSQTENQLDVFLIDHGNILSVGPAHISSCPDDLLELPPKLVCGFLANMLLLRSCPHSLVEEYLLGLVGRNVTGYVQGLLPHKVTLLEVPDINQDLVRHGFGRHVDRDSFVLVVEMLTGKSLKHNMQPVPDLVVGKLREPEFACDPASWKSYKELLSLGGHKLSRGTRVRVRVTAAVKPGLFHCQMVSKERDLQEMSKKLAELFQQKTEEHRSRTPENLGLLCAVRSKEGTWCRGFLPFLPFNAQVRVILVDYGFFETVDVENVRWLPPSFCSTPIMALPCSLEEAIGPEQLAVLRAALLGDVVDMEINRFDETQHLYSVTLNQVEDENEGPQHVEKRPAAAVKSASKSNKPSRPTKCSNRESVQSKSLRKTVRAEDLRINLVFAGFVQHAQSPNHFWIRTQKRNEEFEAMMSQMAEHFREVKLEEDVLPNPQPGALCCAMYEDDMHFYRAVVTDVLEHGAEVLFIDFGNTEKVPFMLIKRMPAAFASKPAFAMNCTLAHVFAFEIWTSATCDFFRNAVLDKLLKVRVVNMGSTKVGVELTELDGAESWNITDLLVSSKPDECFSTKVRNARTDPTKRHLQLPGGTDGVGEEGKVEVPSSFKASSIKPGCELTVRCSLINSPSEFWCQSLDQAPALEELMEKVQSFYSAHTVPLWAGASCCVAKSPRDGRWYRAVVSRRSRVATALLVDYGDAVQVEEEHLQGVAPEFLHVEEQAFRCSIHHQGEPGHDWNQKKTKLLKDFVTRSASNLTCRVVSQVSVENKGLYNLVDLYNAQNQQSAADTLSARDAKQQTMAVPETFVYSSFDLSPGCEELVYVTHISSQWELYCHLDRNTDAINELQENISVESRRMMQDASRGAATTLCLARYLDGNWYRASARPTALPMYLDVFYVDFGNKQVSEESAVMFIPRDCAELLDTPVQAVRCCLHAVPQTELQADAAEFLSRAAQDRPLRAAVRGRNPDGSFDVELFDGDVSINDKVKEILQSRCSEATTPGDPGADAQHGKNEQGCDTPSGKRRPAWPRPETSPSATKLKARPKILFPSSSRHKGAVKPKSGGASQVVGSTRPPWNPPEQQQHKVPKQPQHGKKAGTAHTGCLPHKDLPAGFRAKCFVSHVRSMKDFHLQLLEDDPAILQLEEDLNSASFRVLLRKAAAVRVGDPVVAVYKHAGALYRAVVKERKGGSSLDIEFVDYGNSAVVEEEDVYAMPERLRSLARFGLACSLPGNNAYEDDAAFIRAVVDRELAADFIGRRGNSWEVQLEVLDDGPHAAPREDPPSSSAKTKETVKVPEFNRPTGQARDAPVGSSMLKAPLTSQKASRPQKKKHTVTKKKPKYKAPFVQLVSAFANAFMTLNIQAEDQESAMVLSVQRSGRFYARLQRTSYLLAVLERHLNTNINTYQTAARKEVRKELRCLVQVQTGSWKRAVVRRVASERCRVFLVDHGAAQEVPSCFVRHQCSNLAKIPDLAVLCSADGPEAGEDDGAARGRGEGTNRLVVGREVKLLFLQHQEAKNLWLVEVHDQDPPLSRRLRTPPDVPPAAGPQDVPAAEGPAVDTRPQEPVHVPVNTNESRFGFAAAVSTPSSFCVVLGDELPLESPPPQETYRCVLRGVTPASEDGRWSEEAAAFFRQRVLQRKLHVFFRERESDAQWKVDVTADGVHVASQLVAAGHAHYVDVMLALRFQDRSADSEDEFGREDEGSDGPQRITDVQQQLHSRRDQCVAT